MGMGVTFWELLWSDLIKEGVPIVSTGKLLSEKNRELKDE